MEIIKIIFMLIVEIVISVIMIGTFSEVFKELGISYLIPFMWLVFIIAVIGSIIAIAKHFD